MSRLTKEIIDEVNNVLEEAYIMNNIVRDSQLQKDTCETLVELRAKVGFLKSEAVKEEDEDSANILLAIECVADFLKSEITMWLLLKSDQPDEAWRSLVDAQRAAGDAVRAHSGYEYLQEHVERLHQIEIFIFPPQVFTSIGLIVRCRRCSICNEEYGECAHLVGKPYRGEICHTVITEIEKIDHVAIVTEPANKNCRVTSFSVPGGVRNRMTWKIEPATGRTEVGKESDVSTSTVMLFGPGEDFE